MESKFPPSCGKVEKTPITLTKLYPGLNKGGPELPISQLSQMGLNMTQINTFQLSNGTRLPSGEKENNILQGPETQGNENSHSITPAAVHTWQGREAAGGEAILTHPHVLLVALGSARVLTRKLRVGSGPGAGCRASGVALLSSPARLQGQGDLCPSAHRAQPAAWGHGRCCWCSRCDAHPGVTLTLLPRLCESTALGQGGDTAGGDTGALCAVLSSILGWLSARCALPCFGPH